MRGWLEGLADRLKGPGEAGHGGARLTTLTLPGPEGPTEAVVKSQGSRGALRDWAARRWGTAAERAWRVALRLRAAGLNTPEPIAWLDRWRGGRLEESHYITRRVTGWISLKDEFSGQFRAGATTDALLPVLTAMAEALRTLHAAGIRHGDLGNQNVFLRRGVADRPEVWFVDLSRGRLYPGPVPLRAAASDLCRLWMPSDVLRIFLEMYSRGRVPAPFRRAENLYRRLFELHTRSRALRHPIREARLQSRTRPPPYPPPPDLWIWDEKSAQPVNALTSRDRRRYHAAGGVLLCAVRTARHSVPALADTARRIRGAFREPVALDNALALAVEPRPGLWETERALLDGLGRVPLMIRLYRHKGAESWRFALEAGRALHEAGHPVSLALVQDRAAVADPALWDAFCGEVVPRAAGWAEWLEVGHASNRVKWGLWDLRAYRRLVEPLAEFRAAGTEIRLTGPAAIDFDFTAVSGLLDSLPREFRFDALSHHLYVDRRGPPENRQLGFSTVGKLALLRSLARQTGRVADRLIVSEVNWPLADTGVYSPVCSPYLYPGQNVGSPNVSEEDYADFLVRYGLQAVASGLAERVYWWRLAARGYGLTDDQDEWRRRPGYFAFRQLARIMRGAVFLRNRAAPPGVFAHELRRADGEHIVVAYRHGAGPDWRPDFPFEAVENRSGDPVPPATAAGASPVYYRGVEPGA